MHIPRYLFVVDDFVGGPMNKTREAAPLAHRSNIAHSSAETGPLVTVIRLIIVNSSEHLAPGSSKITAKNYNEFLYLGISFTKYHVLRNHQREQR